MSTLHITNGDCAAGTLRTFLPDPVLITCDVLHDGPAPAVDGDAWYDVRARFLAGPAESPEAIRAGLAAFDRAAVESSRHDEVVLWFEHDLYDQLLLIRTLDLIGGPERPALHQTAVARPFPASAPPQDDRATARLAEAPEARRRQRRHAPTNVSLICIGEFPGVERFIGLGQLNAAQLASLQPTRARVTNDQFALASEAWQAYRAADPLALYSMMVRLQEDVTNGLPFLSGAIHRLFEEYPSTTNGLSRSAEAILRAASSGPSEAGALFSATQTGEARPFMGDFPLFRAVVQLASARIPLVTVAPAPTSVDIHGHSVAITDAGRAVLAGRADAVALNGIDDWRGGVHLHGADRSPWRWDPRRETLVS